MMIAKVGGRCVSPRPIAVISGSRADAPAVNCAVPALAIIEAAKAIKPNVFIMLVLRCSGG
jgi:hypothetical protein